jgi:hypothetical protein
MRAGRGGLKFENTNQGKKLDSIFIRSIKKDVILK